MLFPFIETKLENVCLAVAGDKKERPTAVCTPQLWSKLRSIILQDATPFSDGASCVQDASFHFSRVLGEFFLVSVNC
jgi:hypothetical protein